MIHSFEEAAAANEASGGKAFTPGNLAWRNANLLNIYPTKGGGFFSISEKNGRKPRVYSVRFVSDAGKVIAWGDPYRTTSAASDKASREAAKWLEGCQLCENGHAPDARCKALEDDKAL